MKNLVRNANFWLIIGLDILLVALSYYFAYLLRFEGILGADNAANLVRSIWFIVPIKILTFFLFNLYRGMWRYTGISDLTNVIKAVFTSSATILAIILFFFSDSYRGFSRMVFVIDGILTLILIGGSRFFIRLILYEKTKHDSVFSRIIGNGNKKGVRKILLVGAGDAGEKILREILDNRRMNYSVVGFVDDDPRKKGLNIHGIPVLGAIGEINTIIQDRQVDELMITISAATRKEMRQIVEACEETGLKMRTLPAIGELIDGRVSVKAVRDVSYEDLMGRQPVKLETERIEDYIKNKKIFVTGAGGSIGSELCRQIARFNPESLIVLDCTENNLYQIEIEMRREFPYLKYGAILGNILNKEDLTRAFAKHHPNAVFHAAAYKHVPMMELNPWEAILNNVRGTQNVLEAVSTNGLEKFVLVSTDKAVRPTNVMGASKRVGELLTQCYAAIHKCCFMAVRFGNVIGSSGSVIPLFKNQIEKGGPVTVTHPEVTRFFMTIPEAAQLILQAGAMGEGGEIFILDMGSPIKIADLARDLIRLSGFVPDEDIEIKYCGLRPGEKLYEELITVGEGIVPTGHEKIMVLKGNGCDLSWLQQKVEELIAMAKIHNVAGIKGKLKEIVPEYEPYEGIERRGEGGNRKT